MQVEGVNAYEISIQVAYVDDNGRWSQARQSAIGG